jgi:hypothetical protein
MLVLQATGDLVPDFMGLIAALHKATLAGASSKGNIYFNFGDGIRFIQETETTYSKELQIIEGKAWPLNVEASIKFTEVLPSELVK